MCLLVLCQGEPAEQQNGVAEGNQTQRPPRRRFWRPYRRWLDIIAYILCLHLQFHKCKAYLIYCLCIHRPFRPRPGAEEPTEGQQVAAPEEPQQQTEASEAPQTNGDTAEGQDQKKQRRQPRRRRQRTSESSTSKVSVVILCGRH